MIINLAELVPFDLKIWVFKHHGTDADTFFIKQRIKTKSFGDITMVYVVKAPK